jgi:hypothetical protein
VHFHVADTRIACSTQPTAARQHVVEAPASGAAFALSKHGCPFHHINNITGSNFWSMQLNDLLRIVLQRAEGRPASCAISTATTSRTAGPTSTG